MPSPHPVSLPVLPSETVRKIFLANGFRVAPGHTDLKEYVYRAADALLAELLTTIQYTDLMRASAELVAYRNLLSYNETYFPEAAPGEVKSLIAKLERAMPPHSKPVTVVARHNPDTPVVLSDFGNDGQPPKVTFRWSLPAYYTPTATTYRVRYYG